jgi:glycogen debranching enzyme
LTLAPGEDQVIELKVSCLQGDREPLAVESHEQGLESARDWLRHRTESIAAIRTNNERANDWLERSRADIDMLVTDTAQGPYAYAGIPWFSTAFGRDGIITALECLWLDPQLAAGTLKFLAYHQATRSNPAADAEPGKILHETRKGEMAVLGEVPFGCYYGGVDATPLFVVLAAAYYQRSGDLELIRALWPNIEAALTWMQRYGDIDGDGFLEYDRKSVNGLINQGWKDSADSIFHADGRLAEAPIALVEVQAYAYAAYRGAATLARALGEDGRAEDLEQASETLKERFEKAFWLDDMGTYALALDGAKQPCRVHASNAGHVLFGGLATPDRAARVAERLVDEKSFSGWGIRTIAEGEARYNPLSYHNGSVWPHDNALIAMGFARYGLKAPLVKVMSGLFDAAFHLELHRLPELFCGFPRRTTVGPTEYPVACAPQAWSSAAAFALLGASLGMSFEAPRGRVTFHQPTLPDWLDECRLSNLRVGQGRLDLLLRRTQDDVAIHVVRREGPVEVVAMI